MHWHRNSAAKRAWSGPSGSPDPGVAPRLIPPAPEHPAPEIFLVLSGLNLHPERMSALSALAAARGHGLALPALTGFSAPGDRAQGRVLAEHWLADVDRAWEQVRVRYPRARCSLIGYSLGALLGLTWAHERGLSLRRALTVSPALRLKPHVQLSISLMSACLPGALRLPSRAPRAYRFQSKTSVAAYRAVGELVRRLDGPLRDWLAGIGAPPPLLIASSGRDELIDTRVIAALGRAAPSRVRLQALEHRPRPGHPIHLGVDAHTLGEAQWAALEQAVGNWLEKADLFPQPDRKENGQDPSSGDRP